MSLIGSNEHKEQQRINELQRKIAHEKTKLDKKLTRQKILLGTFLIDMLEKNSVTDLREYTANNLPNFLKRETDKNLLGDLIISLGGTMLKDEDLKNNEDHI